MGRSVLAVLAGFIATTVLVLLADQVIHTGWPDALPHPDTGQSVTGGWLANVLAYSFGFGVVGGWVAARLAPSAPVRHALALGVLAALIGIPVAITTWGQQPAWYQLALPLIPVPAAWLGGRWRVNQLQRNSSAVTTPGV